MSTRKEEMANAPIARLLFRYSLPAVAGLAVDALYNFVDAVFIGQGVGILALGALSIAFPLMLLIIGAGICMGVGAASVLSRALGAGDDRRAARAAGNSFSALALSSLPVMTLGTLFLEPLLRVFGATDSILPFAREYMAIQFCGTFFWCFSISTREVVRAEGAANAAMVGAILGTGTNLLLDPLFIFVFGWGIAGASWATVLGYIVSSLYYIAFYASGRSILALRWSDLRLDIGLVLEELRIGASSLARLTSASLLSIILNNSIAFYGQDAHLAILSISYRLLIMACLPLQGIGQAMQPIVAFNFGAGKLERAGEALRTAILWGIVFGSAISLLYIAFTDQLFAFFTGDAWVIAEGVPVLRVMLLMMPLFGMFIASCCFFQSLGRAGPAMLLNLGEIMFMVPLAFLVPPFLGIWGIWVSYPLADCLAIALAFVMLRREAALLRPPPPETTSPEELDLSPSCGGSPPGE